MVYTICALVSTIKIFKLKELRIQGFFNLFISEIHNDLRDLPKHSYLALTSYDICEML